MQDFALDQGIKISQIKKITVSFYAKYREDAGKTLSN